MKRKLLVQAASLLLLFLGTQAALADTVNFDNVADGTVINTAYTGVTFSCFSSGGHCEGGANSGNVYARSTTGAVSAPNVISVRQTTATVGIQDNVTGAIEVSFATAQSAVSIDSVLFQAAEGLGSSGYGYLEAFDSSFNLLGIVQNVYGGDPTNLGVTKTLTFSSAAGNISYLLLGDVQGANIFSYFDNLCYSTDAAGCTAGGGGNPGGGGDDGGGGTSVPEPASLLMLGSGVFGIGALRRRFQK